MNEMIKAVLCISLFLLISACEFGEESECPLDCTSVVEPDTGDVIECHCPPDIMGILCEEEEK